MKTQPLSTKSVSSIEHPGQSVPQEIALSLRNLHQANLTAQARQQDIAKLSRPNQEERKVIAQVRESVSNGRGVTAELIQKISDINRRINDRIKERLDREVTLKNPFELHLWDSKPPQPPLTDPTFWWARTDWYIPDHFFAGMDNEGLRFTGGVSTHDGDLHNNSFGAVALFGLQPARIPMSMSGLWRSAPYVELFGGLLAHTADYLLEDAWSKCWMHLDQQLFQWGFSENGPAPIVLGQKHESMNLIFEEDEDRTVNVGLPGFQLMPPVTLANINRTATLWARLEIRFDIQTEGAGSLLWLDPHLLLRTFQWPLTAL